MSSHKRTISEVTGSYNFKEYDPVIDRIMAIYDQRKRENPKLTLKQIAGNAGTGPTTLPSWRDKKVRRPQFTTANRVARALGYNFALVPFSGSMAGKEMVPIFVKSLPETARYRPVRGHASASEGAHTPARAVHMRPVK